MHLRIQATLFNNAPYRSTSYIHHLPDKQPGHIGNDHISKQMSMKVMNSDTTTKR